MLRGGHRSSVEPGIPYVEGNGMHESLHCDGNGSSMGIVVTDNLGAGPVPSDKALMAEVTGSNKDAISVDSKFHDLDKML